MLTVAYLLSFPLHDACGDVEAGRILRRALLEKLEACPYSAGAKETARTTIIDELSRLASELIRHPGETPWANKELGHNPDGSAMSCQDYRQSQPYVEKRERLSRYGRGEIGVDEAIGADCPSGLMGP
jgi:hypothetical protein